MTIYPRASVFSGMYADVVNDRNAARAIIATAVDEPGANEVVDDLADRRMMGARRAIVEVATLPTVLQMLGDRPIDLLKIDAEGSERDIFGEMRPSDWHLIDRIVMEVHRESDVPDLEEQLSAAGYRCTVHRLGALQDAGFTNLVAQRPWRRRSDPGPNGIVLPHTTPPDPQERLTRAIGDFLRPRAQPADVTVVRDADQNGRRPSVTLEVEPSIAVLAGIWREVLDVEVGPADDFFRAGGTSLLAVRMLARVRRELGIKMDLEEFMADPALASLARRGVSVTTSQETRPPPGQWRGQDDRA